MDTKLLFETSDWQGFTIIREKNNKPITFIDDTVNCGFASPANDYTIESIDVSDLLVHNFDATYIVRAKGNSMINAGIGTGDYLMIDRSKQRYHMGIALCSVNYEFTVKMLDLANDEVVLVPANVDFGAIILTEGDELIVWGMVTWVLKNVYKL